LLFFMTVSVAQLVERWIVAPVVVGSIPITHPKLFSSFQTVSHNRFGSSVQDGDLVAWGDKWIRVGV
jgi:hypothetical protein